MPSSILIRNCRAICPDHVLSHAAIRIDDGLITSIGPEADANLNEATSIDADGRFVAPGFVDVHCHGDGTTRYFDDPERVSENLLKGGVTSVLATLGYPDMRAGELAAQLRAFTADSGQISQQIVAGIHLEGPYVNPKYGAQTTRGMIKNPEPEEYRTLLSEFGHTIKWWTCAPELPGAAAFIREAVGHGGVVGAGHTEATAEQLATAIDSGLRVITHWTNATGNPGAAAYRGTRYPGIDEASLVFDEVTAEVIPDEQGLHVHPLMAKLLYKAKGPDRVMIITDAGYARPDDPPETGARRDVSIDANGDLAGSRLTMAGAARNFRRFSGCSWPELFRMAALNPARLLGVDQELGSLEVGKRANLILCNEALEVSSVYSAGDLIPNLPAS